MASSNGASRHARNLQQARTVDGGSDHWIIFTLTLILSPQGRGNRKKKVLPNRKRGKMEKVVLDFARTVIMIV